jgi:D-alanyl-D-alanine carboxypeptidase
MNFINSYLIAFILFLFISLVLVGCAIIPPKLPPLASIQTTKDLEIYLEDLVNTGEPPGLSVVVVKGDKIVYQRSFGEADGPGDIAATPDTAYQWWSLTKIFTSVAILQMIEAGQLNLDDRVDHHIPFFDVDYPGENSDPIRIQHLLSHSSGLGDIGLEILGWIHFDGDNPLSQTELLMSKLPEYRILDYEPGSEGRYSNLGYLVLAAIIEKVSGRSYADHITKSVLQPLGMEHTGFSYSDEMRKNEAVGSHPVDLMSLIAFHYVDKAQAIREKTEGRYWFNHIYSDQQGATGLIGTSDDLARFMVALLNGGESHGTSILSAGSTRLMGTPIVSVTKSSVNSEDDYRFGLGWFYLSKNDRVSLSHGGAGAAFVDMMRLYPNESLGIAVMANSTYLGRTMGAEIVDTIAGLDWEDE